jgi:hypothetical protein
MKGKYFITSKLSPSGLFSPAVNAAVPQRGDRLAAYLPLHAALMKKSPQWSRIEKRNVVNIGGRDA